MSNDININDFLKNSPLKSVKSFLLPFFIVFLLLGSIYTVDANENAVVLRLGKYNSTTGPGLHLKLPLLSKLFQPEYRGNLISREQVKGVYRI